MLKELIIFIFMLVLIFPIDAFTLEKGEQIEIFKMCKWGRFYLEGKGNRSALDTGQIEQVTEKNILPETTADNSGANGTYIRLDGFVCAAPVR